MRKKIVVIGAFVELNFTNIYGCEAAKDAICCEKCGIEGAHTEKTGGFLGAERVNALANGKETANTSGLRPVNGFLYP